MLTSLPNDPKLNIRILEEIKKYPQLYNIRQTAHLRHDEIWETIAAQFNTCGLVVKERYRNIRQTICIIIKNEVSNNKTKVVPYLQGKADFLKPFIKTRRQRNQENQPQQEQNQPHQEQNRPQPQEIQQEGNQPQQEQNQPQLQEIQQQEENQSQPQEIQQRHEQNQQEENQPQQEENKPQVVQFSDNLDPFFDFVKSQCEKTKASPNVDLIASLLKTINSIENPVEQRDILLKALFLLNK